MNYVKDEKLLQAYLVKYGIREMFDTPELHFRFFEYDKGEQVVGPMKPLEHILFLVDGTAHIYGLREDSRFLPVSVSTPLTIYGDVEFATGHGSPFFVEAASRLYCAALPLAEYDEILRGDVRFLNTLLAHLGEKFAFATMMDNFSGELEEQVLYYLDNHCPDGCIHSVKDTVFRLRCSRRQLQRVLGSLCEKGMLEHYKKGGYRRTRGADT